MSTEQILCKTRENHALSVWFQTELFGPKGNWLPGVADLETAAFLGLNSFLLEINLLQEPAPLTQLTFTKTPFEGSVSF